MYTEYLFWGYRDRMSARLFTRQGKCPDNAVDESFYTRLKMERVYTTNFNIGIVFGRNNALEELFRPNIQTPYFIHTLIGDALTTIDSQEDQRASSESKPTQ